MTDCPGFPSNPVHFILALKGYLRAAPRYHWSFSCTKECRKDCYSLTREGTPFSHCHAKGIKLRRIAL